MIGVGRAAWLELSESIELIMDGGYPISERMAREEEEERNDESERD